MRFNVRRDDRLKYIPSLVRKIRRAIGIFDAEQPMMQHRLCAAHSMQRSVCGAGVCGVPYISGVVVAVRTCIHTRGESSLSTGSTYRLVLVLVLDSDQDVGCRYMGGSIAAFMYVNVIFSCTGIQIQDS
jgi:hypothetical protein